LLVYDDPKTQRRKDSFEFYDSDTNVLGVGWFNQFGIQRMAIDRGLIDDGSRLQGVFVTLSDGDAL
jgi:hypothetical protein